MKRVWLLLGIWFLGFGYSSISAADQFRTSILVDYRFNPRGQSIVEQHVTLTNLLSHVYATSYQLQIRGAAPRNINAFDSSGSLSITTSQVEPDTTVLTINFNQPATGKGASQKFTLTYEGPPAVQNGQIWEVALPSLSNFEFADSYQVRLTIPNQFGKPAFISPPPASINRPEGSATSTYLFTKADLSSSGIVASFGNFQTYDFRLSFNLDNPSPKRQTLTIALPPDTAYQRVLYDSLEPRPQAVYTDADGNWLANYSLPAKSSLTAAASGQSHILGQPSPLLTPNPEHLQTYLHPDKYWEVDSPQIQKLAKNLMTPRAIYDFVVKSLTYDYSRLSSSHITRRGALQALNSPQSSLCQEFTDLFVAISRAAGIPARRITGFAHTTNPRLQPLSLVSDVLHAWPEYWDSSISVWKAVDPTWGKTTGNIDYFNQLDLGHFTFAIHGTSSTSPLPAGQYKQSSSSKDVQVTLGQYRDYLTQPLTISIRRRLPFLPLAYNTVQLEIANPNGVAFYHLPVTAHSTGLTLTNSPFPPQSLLPPYAVLTLPLKFSPRLLPPFGPKYLTLKVGSQSITYNIPESQFILWYALVVISITILIFSLALFAVKAWNLHLQKLHRLNSLRGQGQQT